MITVAYEKPLTNNIEKDVKEVRDSYLADLQALRDYYGPLFVEAALNSESKIRRFRSHDRNKATAN